MKQKETAQLLCNYIGTSTEVLEQIAKNHQSLRASILRHPNCPKELITWAIGAENKELAYELIKSPRSLSGDELQKIWKRGDINVKVAVTSRSDCPTDLIMDTWNLDFSGDSLFENNQEIAIKNIASHPKIPKKLVVEFMKYQLDLPLDGELNLGELMMLNPGIDDETKALLALRGVEKKSPRTENKFENTIQWWPSTQAYQIREICQDIRELFSRLGHPESILDIRENLSQNMYSAEVALEYWANESAKRIYKCLWPDLANNSKVNIFYHSSWDGDYIYVGIAGSLDLSDEDFKNKLPGEQSWITTDRTLSFEEVMDEIADKGFNDVLEGAAPEEMVVSAAIGEKSGEGLFSITEKGMAYIRDAGNEWFEDNVTYFAQVHHDPSQKVWSELGISRQQAILEVIEFGLSQSDNPNQKFAEYLGALIALNPMLTNEMRERLSQFPSSLIKQALDV